MAVNKTAEPWPDERRSDLDHDSYIKVIKPDYFSLGIHIEHKDDKKPENAFDSQATFHLCSQNSTHLTHNHSAALPSTYFLVSKVVIWWRKHIFVQNWCYQLLYW